MESSPAQLAVPWYDDELVVVDPALLGGVDESYTIVSAQEGGKRSCSSSSTAEELSLARLSAVLVPLTLAKYRQARLG